MGGGTLTLSGTGSEIHFVGVENLTAGSQNDYDYMSAAGQVAGNLNGGSGSDVLSYPTRTNSVVVNLPRSLWTDRSDRAGTKLYTSR